MPRADDTLPLEYTEADERRRKVAQLLNSGVSTREIGRTLNVSETQVRRDLAVIRQQLQADALVGLADRLRLSVAKRKMTQFEAMSLFHRLSDTQARDKVAALTTYLVAQDAIDKLEGTSAPEAQHAAAMAEAFEVMMDTLLEVGGHQMQQRFLEGLQRRNRSATSGLLFGARDAADVEQLVDSEYDSLESRESTAVGVATLDDKGTDPEADGEGEANGHNNGWHPETTYADE